MIENGEVLVAVRRKGKHSRAPQVKNDYCHFCGGVVAKGESSRLEYATFDGKKEYIHALCIVSWIKKYVSISSISHEKSLKEYKDLAVKLIKKEADILAIKKAVEKYERLLDLKYTNGFRIEHSDVVSGLGTLLKYKKTVHDGQTLETVLAACESDIYKKIEAALKAGEPVWSETVTKHLSLLSAVFDVCSVKLKMPIQMFNVQSRIKVPDLVKDKLAYLN